MGTGKRNQAFDDDEGEANGQRRNSIEIQSISKKVFPHSIDGMNLSKIVSFNPTAGFCSK